MGKYTGYYYTVSMTAQIFTPILSNILMEHVGYRTLFPYAAFFVFASFVTMLFVRHGDARPVAKRGWKRWTWTTERVFPAPNAKRPPERPFRRRFCGFFEKPLSSEKKIGYDRVRYAAQSREATGGCSDESGKRPWQRKDRRAGRTHRAAQHAGAVHLCALQHRDRIFIGQIPGEGALALAGAAYAVRW